MCMYCCIQSCSNQSQSPIVIWSSNQTTNQWVWHCTFDLLTTKWLWQTLLQWALFHRLIVIQLLNNGTSQKPLTLHNYSTYLPYNGFDTDTFQLNTVSSTAASEFSCLCKECRERRVSSCLMLCMLTNENTPYPNQETQHRYKNSQSLDLASWPITASDAKHVWPVLTNH